MSQDNKNDPKRGAMRSGSMKTAGLGIATEDNENMASILSQFGTRAVYIPILGRPVWVAAGRGKTEPHRIDRLVALAFDLAAHGVCVRHLFDAKGRLSIDVTVEVTAKLKRKVAQAWGRFGEYLVEAYFENGELVYGTEQSALSWLIDAVEQEVNHG